MLGIESLLIGVGTLLGAGGQEPTAPAEPIAFFQPVQPPRKVQVMARLSTARLPAPPNTIRAIELAWGDSVEWAEVDVRVTKDGQHVLFYDENLDLATNGSGRVRERTLAEIEALDVGSKFARRFAREGIPSLRRALEYSRKKINLKLNCVDVDPAQLVRDVLEAKMETQVMVSGRVETIDAVRAAGGRALAVSTIWHPADGYGPWSDRVAPTYAEIGANELTPEVGREFHRRGVKVLVSSIGKHDRPVFWERAIAAGCDIIRTDIAEEIVAMFSRKAIGVMPIKIAIHRGAGRYAPENTHPAFEKAFRLGADFVEFDVRTTRDGGFFLMHDASVGRTTSGKGLIKELDQSDVRQLDAGSWFARPFMGTRVPNLNDFLDANGKRMELYFDAKNIEPEALAAAIAAHGLTERTVVYQGVDYLEKLRSIAPGIRRMPPLGDVARLDELVRRVQPYAVDARWSILSRETIDRCHAKGVKVFSDALGLNETIPRYQQAIRDGIDVIQTDQPVRVLRAIELMQSEKPR